MGEMGGARSFWLGPGTGLFPLNDSYGHTLENASPW